MLQVELLRLRLERGRSPAVVSLGAGSIRSGRGAYICRRRVCLDRAVHRKAFHKAFRENVTVDVAGIVAALEAEALKGPNDNDTAGG